MNSKTSVPSTGKKNRDKDSKTSVPSTDKKSPWTSVETQHTKGETFLKEVKEDLKKGFLNEMYQNLIIPLFKGSRVLIILGMIIYFGMYKNGMKEGQGIYTWSNGSSYDGEWKNGERSGYGTYKYYNEEEYVGEYVGELVDGKKHGLGKHTYEDGRIFKGEFKLDQPNGKGVIIYPDGDWLEVFMLNGNLIYTSPNTQKDKESLDEIYNEQKVVL